LHGKKQRPGVGTYGQAVFSGQNGHGLFIAPLDLIDLPQEHAVFRILGIHGVSALGIGPGLLVLPETPSQLGNAAKQIRRIGIGLHCLLISGEGLPALPIQLELASDEKVGA